MKPAGCVYPRQISVLTIALMRAFRSRSPTRVAAGVMACAWLAVGFLGAYHYVHAYAIYRGFPVPSTPAGIPQGKIETVRFRSPSIGRTSRYMVYLPPGYTTRRRYPVLYLLHGYPGKMPVWINVGAVHVAANIGIAQHRMNPMILVMPGGKSGVLGADTEWANTPSGRWEDYVVDVVRDVDARFSTLADRAHRGLLGDSEGAFGAVNVGLHHLEEFSVLESGGGYFTETPTGVFAGASAAALAANSPASYVGSLAPRIRRLGLRAWLFQGRTDPHDPALLRSFAGALHRAGADVRVGFFPGGHDWGLFRAQAPRMLTAASRWFARPPRGRPARLTHTGSSLSKAQLRRIRARRRAARAQRCAAAPCSATCASSSRATACR
jgi:enterochelin esterase-like enzyme